MNYTYKVYYTILVPCQFKDKDMVITAPTPVRALDIFHRQVQSVESKMALTGVVSRPKLKPEDYTIVSLVHRYKDTDPRQGGTGQWVEAKVDLPATPNPNVMVKREIVPDQTMEMELNDERKPA